MIWVNLYTDGAVVGLHSISIEVSDGYLSGFATPHNKIASYME